MEFQLNETQKVLKETAREYMRGEVRPRLVEEGQGLPQECVEGFAKMGLLGICLAEEYGGAARPLLDAVLVIEEAIQVSYSAANLLHNANMGPARIIEKFGLEELKKKVLPQVIDGKAMVAPGMTEPEAGSALTDIQTKAVLTGDHYTINGAKTFQNLRANYYLVYARVTEDKGARGIGAILVSKDSPGFGYGSIIEFMGLKSRQGEIIFEECRVPRENLVVGAGGFSKLMQGFNMERLGNAASCLGLAQYAIERSSKYVTERKQFGKPICEFQGVQFMLADMVLKTEAARLLIYRAACNAGRDFPSSLESSLAKCFANEMVTDVTGLSIQIHGGYGY
jgi:butyryl-CoA dehydrogenase